MNLFVTGGNEGIGRAIVEQALEKGHGVGFTYFENKSEAQKLLSRYSGRNVKAYELDVRDSSRVDAVADQVMEDFGTLDAVINNAGTATSNLAINVTNEEWDRIIKTNLYGPFYVTRAFLHHFLQQKKGAFVNIGSIDQDGARGNVSYSSSKAGLMGLSLSIAKEYGSMGIRSNIIKPGFVDTKMIHGHEPSKILEKFFNDYSLTQKYIQPIEIANFVLFLASDESSAINGAVLPITAGLSWRP